MNKFTADLRKSDGSIIFRDKMIMWAMWALSVTPQVKVEVANRGEVRVNSSADVQLQGLGIQHINNPPVHSSLSQPHPPFSLALSIYWIKNSLQTEQPQNTFVKSEYSLNTNQVKRHIILTQFEIILT